MSQYFDIRSDLSVLLSSAFAKVASLLPHDKWTIAVPAAIIGSVFGTRHLYYKYIHDRVIFDEPIPFRDFPPQSNFDARRHDTYPSSYLNAWYHLCDCSELKINKMLEFHVVGQTLILWRKSDGTVVCQDAYCPHAGIDSLLFR